MSLVLAGVWLVNRQSATANLHRLLVVQAGEGLRATPPAQAVKIFPTETVHNLPDESGRVLPISGTFRRILRLGQKEMALTAIIR